MKEKLEERGITVITREVSAFHRLPSNSTFQNANRAYIERFGRTFGPDETVPSNICKVMNHVLSEFFGDGPRVCMEIALMAADSGQLPLFVFSSHFFLLLSVEASAFRSQLQPSGAEGVRLCRIAPRQRFNRTNRSDE